MAKRSPVALRYVKSWESHPMLKDWLLPMVGDERAAFCKFCERPLHPHKKDLLLHSKSEKHKRNAVKYVNSNLSDTPLKEIDYDSVRNYEADSVLMNSGEGSSRKEISISVFAENEKAIPASSCTATIDEPIGEMASILINEGVEEDPFTTVDPSSPFYEFMINPKYNGWLRVDGERLFCRLCVKDVRPNNTELVKHTTLKHHQKKCFKMGISSSQINEERLSLKLNTTNISTCESEEVVIDLRSDTITQPNKDMLDTMVNTITSDDVLDGDPSVKDLEEKVCALLNMQKGLFLPSGTMANLIAVMAHCWNRDSEVYVGDESFLFRWSQGGLARIGGVNTRTIRNEEDGTFSLSTLKELLKDSSNFAVQSLVCVENTHCRLGGRVLPLQWLEKLVEFCREKELILHMDGARLVNASLFCGASLADLVSGFNSATFCLNKTLGCPIGSVLVGTPDFIVRAKRIRALLGGAMHQAGIFSAAAIQAIDTVIPKLHWDHANARAIAQSVYDIYSTAVTVDMPTVQTNYVHLHMDSVRVNAEEFCLRLSQIKESEFDSIGQLVRVLAYPISDSIVRLVTHYDLTKRDVQTTIKKLQFVINEYDSMLDLSSIMDG